MSVDLICPLYHAESYLDSLHSSILAQQTVNLHEVHYVVTDASQEIVDRLKKLDHCVFRAIDHTQFSHSRTREEEAFRCEADILVFITQDIHIHGNDWLSNLIRPIVQGDSAASYGRQICTNHTIERYTREKNYPEHSMIKSRNDISTLGFYTYFFSDACSAVKRSVFNDLDGYDHKDFPSNEDTYMAYKLITNGYSIAYCADAVVDHSHQFSLKQLYDRYYLTGAFFAMEPELKKLKAESAGAGLAKYILKRAMAEKNFRVIFGFVPNMAARYLGMKAGEHAK